MEIIKNFMKILVVGDNPDEHIKRYDLATKVEPYVTHVFDNKKSDRKKALRVLSNVLSNKDIIPLSTYLSASIEKLHGEISRMTDFEYYLKICEGCWFNEETGDAMSNINKDAEYQYATSYDKLCRKMGENVGFIQPFILKDGTVAFSAKKGDVNWKDIHFAPDCVDECRKVWELCVEKREPVNDDERKIYDENYQSVNYFNTFNIFDEYMIHNSAFWCDGIIIDGKYIKCDGDQRAWEKEFYKKFIKPLSDDTLLTLYEAKTIS